MSTPLAPTPAGTSSDQFMSDQFSLPSVDIRIEASHIQTPFVFEQSADAGITSVEKIPLFELHSAGFGDAHDFLTSRCSTTPLPGCSPSYVESYYGRLDPRCLQPRRTPEFSPHCRFLILSANMRCRNANGGDVSAEAQAAMSGPLLLHIDWSIFSPHTVWRPKASPADGPP